MAIQKRAETSVCSLLAVTSAMLAPLLSLCPHRTPGETTLSLSATQVDFGQNSAPSRLSFCSVSLSVSLASDHLENDIREESLSVYIFFPSCYLMFISLR